MARQRKLSPERKACINSLLEHYQTKMTNVQTVANYVKLHGVVNTLMKNGAEGGGT